VRLNTKGSAEKELAKLTDEEWSRAQHGNENLVERVPTRLVLEPLRKQLSCSGFDASKLWPLAEGWDLNDAGRIGLNLLQYNPCEKEIGIVRQVTSDGM